MSTEEGTDQNEMTETEKDNGNCTIGSCGNENITVLDVTGESEDLDRDDKTAKESKDKVMKNSDSDGSRKTSATESSTKPSTANPKQRKKLKAPVVDVNSLRKRKWQLKVYPLHADDLQLNYMSILCRLASESLLYIPSEGRHGKAELYVATQKETAAIIGKLLRMGFHHSPLSIEVVRKDTGGKEDGNESKKECKAFLNFDKFLTKKIYDAKGEKGAPAEKVVTLSKLPKAATKDFVGALFPFATGIEIVESDDPDERKAHVSCKTPVTALLVYKSFKRLEINDVHVKISISDSVKEITLPPMFFMPPVEKKPVGPPDSIESLNQSSLPRRPMMTPLNRRVQMIKKRAILNSKRPMMGQLARGPRLNQGFTQVGEGQRGIGPRPLPNRDFKMPGLGGRDYMGGPGRRRMMERLNDRRNRGFDSGERHRGDGIDSQVTTEMLQLQSQLNQAIKNQIAMLNTTQATSSHLRASTFLGSSPRSAALGQGSRSFGGDTFVGSSFSSSRSGDSPQQQADFGGISWSYGRGGRISREDRNDGNRSGRAGRSGVGRGSHTSRPDNKRMELSSHGDNRSRRSERSNRENNDRSRSRGEESHQSRRSQPQSYGVGSSSDGGHSKRDRSEKGSSHVRRSTDYSTSGRSNQRSDGAYNSSSQGQASSSNNQYSDYNHSGGDGNSYYRHF